MAEREAGDRGAGGSSSAVVAPDTPVPPGVPRRMGSGRWVRLPAAAALAAALAAPWVAARAGPGDAGPAEATAAVVAALELRAAALRALPDLSRDEARLLRAMDRALALLADPLPAAEEPLAAAAARGLKAVRRHLPPGVDPPFDAARDALVACLLSRADAGVARAAEEGVVLRSPGAARKVGAKARAAARSAAKAGAAVLGARPDGAARFAARSLAASGKGLAAAAAERGRRGLDAFDRVRGVFAASCNATGCHTTADAAGGLDLQSPYAWGDLRRGAALHPGAAARGRRLVVPGEPDASFLYLKCAGTHEADEGDAMPGPGAPLGAGSLALVRAWIEAGAPPSSAADVVLRAPASGFQVRVPPYRVDAGGEDRAEAFSTVPGGVELRAARIEFLAAPGVRIARLFEARALAPGDPRDVPDGTVLRWFGGIDLDQWSVRAASPSPTLDWVLPEGTGVPFLGGARLLLEAHADDLGSAGAAGGGGAVVNVHTVPVEAAPTPVGTWYGSDGGILVPPQSTVAHVTGATFEFLFHSGDVDVVAAFGRTRSRGDSLEIRAWDGVDAFLNGTPPPAAFSRMGEASRLWFGDDWEHPRFSVFALDEVVLPAGWGALFRTVVTNPTAEFLATGPRALTEEIAEATLFFVPGPPEARTLWFPQPTQ